MSDKPISLRRQIGYQLIAFFVLFVVIFPVLWVFSMAVDPRDLARPNSLIPPGASLKAFQQAISNPTPNPVDFLELARNSSLLAVGVSLFTIMVGTTAAYAFSRFRFAGRQIGMLAFVIVLMIPSTATLAALFVMLNIVIGPTLRNSITGVGIAMIAGALPFAIWNMKGFIDTIPKELEEAALIDGCSPNQTFWRIMLPVSGPIAVVTIIWQFTNIWNDFLFGVAFSGADSKPVTVGLNNMANTTSSVKSYNVDMAAAIIAGLPTMLVYVLAGQYFVKGLTAGAVKG